MPVPRGSRVESVAPCASRRGDAGCGSDLDERGHEPVPDHHDEQRRRVRLSGKWSKLLASALPATSGNCTAESGTSESERQSVTCTKRQAREVPARPSCANSKPTAAWRGIRGEQPDERRHSESFFGACAREASRRNIDDQNKFRRGQLLGPRLSGDVMVCSGTAMARSCTAAAHRSSSVVVDPGCV